MITKENYCDYETCVALKKLGYNEKTLAYYTSEGFFHWVRAYIYDVAIPDLANSSNKKPYKHIIDAMSLYEAQKWLREEKKMEVNATSDCLSKHSWFWYHKSLINANDDYSMPTYQTYEEALSEGIKEAVKILKEK